MSIKTYLRNNARKLDLRVYEHLFEGAQAQAVLDELRPYQNEDGGFGHALEPDLRLPESSAIATTVAFQYLNKLKGANANKLISNAIRYFVESYDDTKQRWIIIPSDADKYPRAPWWNYNKALEWAEWGNPSAEILGYLLQHIDKVEPTFPEKITQQAIQRLQEITKPEQHEVLCYIRLYKHAPKELQAKLYDHIAAQIKELAKTDPKDWKGYVATPLTFINSPNSPFASLFDKQVLQTNVEFLQNQIAGNNHWEPTWEWGQFENEWARAKQDWSGKLTVDNLALLKAFGAKVDV
jgi:hypothetical protein